MKGGLELDRAPCGGVGRTVNRSKLVRGDGVAIAAHAMGAPSAAVAVAGIAVCRGPSVGAVAIVSRAGGCTVGGAASPAVVAAVAAVAIGGIPPVGRIRPAVAVDAGIAAAIGCAVGAATAAIAIRRSVIAAIPGPPRARRRRRRKGKTGADNRHCRALLTVPHDRHLLRKFIPRSSGCVINVQTCFPFFAYYLILRFRT